MSKKAVRSPEAPAPIGPYSPAVTWENLVFVSGQGPLDPKTGNPVLGGVVEQARQVFSNIDQLLQAAGTSRENVLKVTVYLAHIADFKAMNEVYQAYFQGTVYPARTTIQAAALPGGIDVEIDVIAYR